MSSQLTKKVPHISVCICTFRRPDLLQRLLRGLDMQETQGLFTYSIVVTDNDTLRSGEAVVSSCAARSAIVTSYCVEPRQNIALARNKAVETAVGDFVAFIDDDEMPVADWLLRLFEVYLRYDVGGVLGPVKPRYECSPPSWMVRGKFFERPTYPTGYQLDWSETRTGNVLFRRHILRPGEPPFRVEFGTGAEDLDFFRRMMSAGHNFVWCNEAVVYETVPASRCNRTYLLRRALLRGSTFSKHPTHRLRNAMKSLIAVPCYVLLLPFLALFGQHLVFSYTIKICDHSSRLLALLGFPVMTTRNGIA
jgi:succinoglycan biosynthesis protein ExoM